MPGTATGDEVSGKTSPLDGRHKVLKPLEPPADASAGRTFPVPLLVPSPKPGSHRRGPPTGKYKSTTEKKAHEPSEYMRQRTKEMQQAGKEADGEAAMKAQFPGGSSGSLTASAAGREAMPGTATGDELARKISPLDWLNKVLKPLETRTDASAGRTFPVPLLVPSPKPGSHRRGPLRGKKKATGHKEADEPNNILKQMVEELHKGNGAASPTTRVLDSQKGPGRGFWIGLIAGLLFLELIFILCCVQIWTCWKRKGDASADSQDWPNTPAMGNWSCHLASPSPCLLSLPRLHYQLIARDSLLVSPPRAGASVPKGAAPGVQPGQEVQPSYQGRA
ncbi:uncharacterized protein LOC131088295 isoform X6 [Melospiza georgiana]|uniref:uncharacterized protein LOC131088295 isoform X6 n=1 Tax=Melospiza georgiana TaxID=44398 RepID=UPI0025AC6826|nr:uncharacterized protein LOC131088295 isoform X6 [Melospiza georgiana]